MPFLCPAQASHLASCPQGQDSKSTDAEQVRSFKCSLKKVTSTLPSKLQEALNTNHSPFWFPKSLQVSGGASRAPRLANIAGGGQRLGLHRVPTGTAAAGNVGLDLPLLEPSV